jgi:predicted HTH transcriptional regulator
MNEYREYPEIESLLYEDESPTLDFKKEQYLFNKATDIQKSELLKDILAFANAWRRADAYILIGVEEVKGKKSNVIGINDDLDDASLQQFVNSKTQRPITFEYSASDKADIFKSRLWKIKS